MKYIWVIIILSIVVGGGLWFTRSNSSSPSERTTSQYPQAMKDAPQTTVVAENLDTPWAIAFLPDNSILVTERAGTVRLIDETGKLVTPPISTLRNVKQIGEGGLLGVAVHPDFANNNFVYFYYTYSSEGSNTLNRVVRMTYADQTLRDERIIVDAIPGAANHDGGRIKFGPDKFLYIGTGDAQEPSLAQDKNSLAGKILRVTDEGKPAPGNPFGNPVYSLGHRNVQGLAWHADGSMYATEHGRSGIASGYDELNLIESGKNYGWPEIQGDEARSGMVTPQKHSGATNTWAPSGAAFVGDSLFYSGLRGQALYEAVVENGRVAEVKTHFKNEYGRIREVVLGPDGMLYITTSNTDGRGLPKTNDDKIIKVNPQKL